MAKGSRITQLRKKGGLSKLIGKVGGTAPQLYYQSEKDLNTSGDPVGPYKIGQILDTKQWLSPQYHARKREWCFNGTPADLSEFIIKTRLRYEDGPQKGQLISEDSSITPEERLKDQNDKFFRHSAFYNKFYIEDDRVSFDQNDPIQAFLWTCQLGRPSVEDRSAPKRYSKFQQNGLSLEAVSPSTDAKEAKSKEKTAVRAAAILDAAEDNEDKLRMLAMALDLPSYSSASDKDQVYMAIISEVIKGEDNARSKFGGKTIQSEFIRLGEMEPSDLTRTANVMLGKRKQIIAKTKSGFLLNGKKIEEVTTYIQLKKFFLDPLNQDSYLELIDSIGEEDAF